MALVDQAPGSGELGTVPSPFRLAVILQSGMKLAAAESSTC
jgi:hypothetical protein